MNPSADPSSGAQPITPALEPLAALLELVASEQPDLLPWAVSVVEQSAGRAIFLELAEEWGVQPRDVRRVAARAARQLDELEPRGGTDPGSLRGPALVAAFHFASQRRRRISGLRRQQRLKTLGRQLAEALEVARQRRRIHSLIGIAEVEEPAVDGPWIQEFLGSRD